MKHKKYFDLLTQIMLPVLTLGGQLALALKYPGLALILMLASQPFWLYSSYMAYKNANQLGMFLNTLAFGVITLIGVINYWVI